MGTAIIFHYRTIILLFPHSTHDRPFFKGQIFWLTKKYLSSFAV